MQNIPVELQARKQALRNNSYFSKLEDHILDDLSLGMRLERAERGEILFWEGDPCAGLHIIKRGSVKLFKTSTHGRELIIKVIEEGTTFNEVPVFDRGQNPVNAASLEDSEIWVVEAGAIQAAMTQHPEMCRAIVLNLTQNLRMLVGLVEELSFFQVTNRLARLISQLPPDQLVGSTNQRITQDQLAARLGTVREVVARSMKELERSGAIRIEERRIQIADKELFDQWIQS